MPDLRPIKLSLIIPCYNERNTLEQCVSKVLAIQNASLTIELIIVDDCSTDGSLQLAEKLQQQHPEIVVLRHDINRGKGAALHSGFAVASGDIVGIQDADQEYEPWDLPKLIVPIVEGQADVVYGSRYRKDEPRRVLYFWHSTMNRFLTTISNMFTDMDLTDMETCYKLFRRDVLKELDLKEQRFGFEPEVTAKVAYKRYRVYEMGISYSPRTYEEGKKIGWKDGFRALYCIFHYSAPIAPFMVQLMIYLIIGGLAAIFNIAAFLVMMNGGSDVMLAAAIAYVAAAAVNYILCILLLFRHKAQWNTLGEIVIYSIIVIISGIIDVGVTALLIHAQIGNFVAKALACFLVLIINFIGRRYLVFKERYR